MRNCVLFAVSCLLLFFSNEEAQAQDVEFSQFYAAPLHLNPAMIGYSEFPRFTINFRDHLPSFSQAFVSFAASYDQHIPKYNSSVGLMLFADRAGGGLLNTYSVNGFYAYELKLSRDLRAKAGFQIGLIQQNVNQAKFIYPNSIDPNVGMLNANLPSGEEPLSKTSIFNVDVSTGMLIYSRSFFAGVAVKHLNQPSFDFTANGGSDNRLRTNLRAHVGKTFHLNDPFFERDQKYVTLSLLYATQGSFTQLTGGAHAGKGPIFGGIYFRHTIENSSSLITLFGVRKGVFRIGYSYDWDLSEVTGAAGAHELSFSMDLGLDPINQKKARLRQEFTCPAQF